MAWRRELKGVVAEREEGDRRPEELSTRIMEVREGTVSEWMGVVLLMLGVNWVRRSIFERGGLYGRLVSVLIIRWDAVRWLRAAMTCAGVNAGFRGT